MSDSTDDIALSTLEHLERRVQRLQHLIIGSDDLSSTHNPAAGPPDNDAKASPQPINLRLSQLERDFSRLCTKSTLVTDILQLQSHYPDLFPPLGALPTNPTIPTSLPPSTLLSIILAYANRFPSITSQLKSVFEHSGIPPAEASMALVRLKPRIDAFTATQERQGEEFLRLQRRTATLLERWYEVGVLAQGDCWAEWDERVRRVERVVRRVEVQREREGEGDEKLKGIDVVG
ncbi:MAG: hypothetical protein M1816_001437 [Peltula sp. TS41687]|nr:MAG: hypothetical protein M1816_001437 [Peltula sp. TS41687]